MTVDRYGGTTSIDWIGESGLEKIRASSCVVVGCGALGSASSSLLVRYGFGSLKIVDRDFVEVSNLERQTLFDENDARMMKPKAAAAAEKLSAVNSQVEVTAQVVDLNPGNIEQILEGTDVVVDGLDNLETRYLLNDFCVKNRIPWVHGACLSSVGMCFNILPDGPCFRCIYPSAPAPGRAPTCETFGILPSVPQTVGAIQAAEAVKIVTCARNTSKQLIRMDLTDNTFEKIDVERADDCPTCRKGQFTYLAGDKTSSGIALCGRDAVQIVPSVQAKVDLAGLENRLREFGEVSHRGYLLHFKKGDHELIVFPDGRAIIKGTQKIGVAKSLYAKYIGN